MKSRVSFSVHRSTATQPTTPARNRRLSNFHKLVPSPSDSKQTPVTQRTPLRPFNRQTPVTNLRRQSFAPKNFHPTPRLSPSNRHHEQRSKQPPLSKAEIAHMYSSTIKLCQDNKINARNTWTLNLIDYMSMLVKDESENVSRTVSFQDDLDTQSTHSADTNFQLAGVTLDAGVKIYCSRVDSVHTNAFKVLGGLSRTDSQPNSTSDDDGDPTHQSINPDNKRQRAAKRTGRSTLETNLANITSHKHETDLAVDPLFHKMSAAFDEGGAKGMLMNNLPVGPQGQVLFDSSEPAEDMSLTQRLQHPETCSTPTVQMYSISELLPTDEVEDDDDICSSFLRFYRIKRRLLDINDSTETRHSNSADTPDIPSNQSELLEQVDENVFADSEGLEFDYDDGDLQNAAELGVFPSRDAFQDISATQDEDDVPLFSTGEDESRRYSVGPHMSVAMAAQKGGLDLLEAGLTLQENSSYAFFDTTSLSGWAGPQHWRFRATAATASVSSITASKDGMRKTKRPRGKTAMLLDFYSAAPTLDFAKEFEPGKTEISFQLSSSVRDGFSKKKVTLPEDLHYSTRNLVSLFLKPATMVKAKSPWKDDNERLKPNDGDDWYDFENDCDNDNYCPAENYDSFDNSDEQRGPPNIDEVELGMKLIDEPTRVEKIDINYAKVAKKVDVRQLKAGLWSKLCGEKLTSDVEANGTVIRHHPVDDEGTEGDLVDSLDIRGGGSQRLQNIVCEVPSFVPADSLSDVSLPYVFICLLHLANEKTLSITQAGNDSLKDLIITSEEVERS